MSDRVNESYTLDWHGPFCFQGEEDLLLSSSVAKQYGVYLLTVEHQGGYLIYSAGLTTRTFKQRFQEHIKAYRTGVYTIFDARKFQTGERVEVWRGFWFRKRTHEMEQEFKNRYEEINLAASELLSAFRIFLAPLTTEKRVLERLEAAIMNNLYLGIGAVSHLPDRGMHLAPRRSDEEVFEVRSVAKVCLHGLPERFEA